MCLPDAARGEPVFVAAVAVAVAVAAGCGVDA